MNDPEPDVTAPADTQQVVSDVVAIQLSEAGQGASLERLTELESKIVGAVRASRAPSTLAAYRRDWADFTLWCETNGLASMPAAPATVAAYLVELGEAKDDRKALAISTIQRRKASISEAHKLAGHLNPCLDPLVKQVTKGLRRRLGVASKRRKAGLSTADVRAIIGGLDGSVLIDVRDRAVLLLGFATAMRRSELVALEVTDVEDHAEGLLVHRRKSKTDQEGAGHRIEVAYGDHLETCPVRAYRIWIDEAGIDDGPVFRAINRHGTLSPTALSDRGVALIVKKHASQIGRDPAEFAGHSLRRGFSTEASRNGAPERTIASTTGHTSTKGLRPYIEDAETFTDPPSRYLGL
ncbi:MAG: site-specific integrase [Acidimicrobiales bacterium]